MTFKEEILQGIPNALPTKKPYSKDANRAPKRKEILSNEEKKLAIKMPCVIFLKIGIKSYLLNLLLN